MNRRIVLPLAAAAAVTAGIFATALSASADVSTPGTAPTAESSDWPPPPPEKPIPSGPPTGTPPTADPSVTPPPWPSFPPDDPEDW